jgi:hypothetical protein
MKGMGDVIAEYQHAAGLVQSMRDVRKQEPWLFDFLQTVTLDSWKYRIPKAEAKSAFRRAVERRFRKVDEIPGLYEKILTLR